MVSQCRNCSQGNPFMLSIVSGIEKFFASEDFVTFFCRKFFVSQYQNIS